ncbi:Solute carrier family 35 member G1 [Holothuria leucospilota]|uniref:Solute carrier family 35 member G1 n=1 Tax=Holothuria leucospilota TaxID=206669 RepID=A0A9Q0YIM3_HOLLE|nr:Solute carrier family 35 member G1 [Holothuria leucospilota]
MIRQNDENALEPLVLLESEDDEGREGKDKFPGLFKRVGLVWAVFSAVFLAAGNVFIQRLSHHFSPILIQFYIQAVFLIFAFFLPWKESEDYGWFDLLLNVLFALADAFGKSSYMTAMMFISISDISAITFNKPIPSSIIACIFLGEIFDVFDGALVVFNCIGLVLVATSTSGTFDDSANVYGVILSFTALVCFVSVHFVTRVLANRGKADPCLLLFMTGWVGMMLCTIYLTLTSSWLFPQNLDDTLMLTAAGFLTTAHYYFLTRALKTENMIFVAAGLSAAIPITYCYDTLFNGLLFAWQNIVGAMLIVGLTMLLYAKTSCKED